MAGTKHEAAERIRATTGLSLREICRAEGITRSCVYEALRGDKESLEGLRARLRPEVFALIFPNAAAVDPKLRSTAAFAKGARS